MTDLVETFKARREVNLGWCKRQAGDFIHEYTDTREIEPRAVDRLLRMGYIERRSVPQSELDEWRKQWDARNAPPAEPDAVEEEVSDAVKAEQEEATVNPVLEEEIVDLGPPEEEKKPKRVVRSSSTRSRRRSGS